MCWMQTLFLFPKNHLVWTRIICDSLWRIFYCLNILWSFYAPLILLFDNCQCVSLYQRVFRLYQRIESQPGFIYQLLYIQFSREIKQYIIQVAIQLLVLLYQDSLLVKRRNDNHSPGPVIRELVPSSHQRSELSNTVLCIFSRWDQRIGEGIPIPGSLGEEATFINICISNGSLKSHRVLISTTPSFGDKVICWYTGFTFKTFI